MQTTIPMRALVVAATLTMSGPVGAGDLPVVVSHLVTGAKSHVVVTNTAAQPVTAWSLATVTPSEGGRVRREVETIDGYLSEVTHELAGSSPRLDRLMPGESRELSLDPLPADATVQVAAVVLDDGAAVGDEQLLVAIFERRSQERDALAAVVDAFRTAPSPLTGAAALDALFSKLTAVVQQNPAVPCRAALDAVDQYRRKAAAGASAADIDQSVKTYAAFVTREYELALKHSRRKGG